MDFALVKDVAIFLAGILVAAIGYLLKRRIEHRSDHEDLELKERLLKINRELKDQSVTPDELQMLEHTLRRGRFASDVPSPTIALLEKKGAGRPERIVTQFQLNQSSYEEFEAAELAMQQAFRRLKSFLEGESLKELDASQAAWKEYRDKQVSLAGGFYLGGSIAPLICNTEAAALTNARARDLASLYEELQSR